MDSLPDLIAYSVRASRAAKMTEPSKDAQREGKRLQRNPNHSKPRIPKTGLYRTANATEVAVSWWRNEFNRWGIPADEAEALRYVSLADFEGKTRALFEEHLRRGVPMARYDKDGERVNYWMSPGQLMRKRFQPGQLLIGKLGDTFLGHLDDRPIITFATSRAGKSTTVLEPNIYLYSGSMLALDPKGELARLARFRRAMGHMVHVLDPFGQSGEPTASFNVFDTLNPDDLAVIDDVISIAYALVPNTEGSGNAKFFSDSARTLLVGLILLTLSLPKKSERNLITVRQLLTLSYKPLADAGKRAAAQAMAAMSEEEKHQYFDASSFALQTLFNKMIASGNKFGGVLASIGSRLKQTAGTERAGVFSTAAVNTDFIDSLLLRRTLRHSDFRLEDLRGDRPTTIFLCLPVGRMDQHFRWLRLIVQSACTILERMGPYPRDRPPILFMLEEFATLGTMDYMERAAAYFPGFGVQPWFVLQDMNQLIRHYRTTYQSFLGNAGLVQLFATGDPETIEYAIRRCGKLIAPWELEQAFAREKMSQVLFFKGEPPAAAMRLEHADVAQVRERAARRIIGLPTFN